MHRLLLPVKFVLSSLSICCSYSNSWPKKLKFGEIATLLSLTYLQVERLCVTIDLSLFIQSIEMV